MEQYKGTCTYDETSHIATCYYDPGAGGCRRCDQFTSIYTHKKYPYTFQYALGQASCYMVCQPKSLKCPDPMNPNSADGIYCGLFDPDTTTACFDTECQYTNADNLTCHSNPDDPCRSFHKSGTTCVSNIKTCTGVLTGNDRYIGYTLWNAAETASNCCITSCTGNYHWVKLDTSQQPPIDNQCHDWPCGECVSNTMPCSDLIEIGCSYGDDTDKYTIGGNATWNTDTNDWDYSGCTCSSTEIKNGRGFHENCKYICDATGTCHWDNCVVTDIEYCNAGYCVNSAAYSDGCVDAPVGYYHGAPNIYDTNNEANWECQPCPLGSTTLGSGRTSINQCAMVGPETGASDVTQFCDNIGCFTLPAGTKIYYAGNEALQNGTQ